MIHLKTVSVVRIVCLGDELERTWKGGVMTYFEVMSQILLKRHHVMSVFRPRCEARTCRIRIGLVMYFTASSGNKHMEINFDKCSLK